MGRKILKPEQPNILLHYKQGDKHRRFPESAFNGSQLEFTPLDGLEIHPNHSLHLLPTNGAVGGAENALGATAAEVKVIIILYVLMSQCALI